MPSISPSAVFSASRLPLVTAALATMFLRERLRPAHYPALGLVALGVAIPFVAAGTFTWIAVVLPITFGIYGFLLVIMIIMRPQGLLPERRRAQEMTHADEHADESVFEARA